MRAMQEGIEKPKSSISEKVGKTVRAGVAAVAISGAFGGGNAEAAPPTLPKQQPRIEKVEQKPSLVASLETVLKDKSDKSFDRRYDLYKQFKDGRYSATERADFVQALVRSADNSLDLDLIVKDAVMHYTLWESDPRADGLLRGLLERDAKGMGWFTLDKEVRPLYEGKPWAEEIDKAILANRPDKIYDKFELFSKYDWADTKLRTWASYYPGSALSNYDKFAAAPGATTVLERALVAADPVLAHVVIQKREGRWSERERAIIQKLAPKNATLEISMLERGIGPDFAALRGDMALIAAGTIDRSLLLPMLIAPKADEAFWSMAKSQFEKHDYYPKEYNTVGVKLLITKSLSAHYGNANPFELEESAAIVARNLYEANVPVNADSVKKEVQRIQERRAELGQVNIFNRDVLLASHGEIFESKRGINKKGDPRFGTKGLEKLIIAQQGPGVIFAHASPLRQEAGAASPAKAKRQTMDMILNSTRPLTVYFDGHGSEEAFYFASGERTASGVVDSSADRKITAPELADALAVRFAKQQKAQPQLRQSNIILVFSACLQQNLVRSLAVELKKLNVPLPEVMMTASEFGQNGYSDINKGAGSKFNDLVAKSRTINEILKNQFMHLYDANPSIFAPAKEDPTRLMQLGGALVPGDSQTA